MSLERAREIWKSANLDRACRASPPEKQNGERSVAIDGRFSADQLEALAVLVRAGEI